MVLSSSGPPSDLHRARRLGLNSTCDNERSLIFV